MSIARGHGFAPREAAPSVVVNDAFARKFFPGENAIGRRIRFGPDDPWFTIVGIATDVKARGARQAAQIETFVPYWQKIERGTNVILKTDTPPMTLAQPLKQAISSIDRNVPLSNPSTLGEIVADSIEQPRFFAVLTAAFALLALTLAAIGIYGVMTYVVSQRTTEIGVRMALGASPGEVFRLVVADGLKLTAAGIVLGAAASLAGARALTALLFGVRPGDPTTLVVMAAVLVLVATAACTLPARRATQVDPMVALRAE
jgi:predicted permease